MEIGYTSNFEFRLRLTFCWLRLASNFGSRIVFYDRIVKFTVVQFDGAYCAHYLISCTVITNETYLGSDGWYRSQK